MVCLELLVRLCDASFWSRTEDMMLDMSRWWSVTFGQTRAFHFSKNQVSPLSCSMNEVGCSLCSYGLIDILLQLRNDYTGVYNSRLGILFFVPS